MKNHLNGLPFKYFVLASLMLLLLIPLSMISSLNNERQVMKREALTDIEGVKESQIVAAPVIIQPYKKSKGDYTSYLKILPAKLDVKTDVQVTPFHRSIYTFQKFNATNQIKGQFDLSELNKLKANKGIIFDPPYLSIFISDPSGLGAKNSLQMQNKTYTFESGSRFQPQTSGIHTMLSDLHSTAQTSIDFDINLDFEGSKAISFYPMGKDTHLSLTSNWPHPKFSGTTMSTQKEINDAGFTAQWDANWLANNMNTYMEVQTPEGHFFAVPNSQFTDTASAANDATTYRAEAAAVAGAAVASADAVKVASPAQLTTPISQPKITTEFIEPVDIYQQTERLNKYAFVLILITFICVHMIELLSSRRVHPIQYGLVGLALVMFYLLLLSLSEHMGLLKAYAGASLACAGLIGFYTRHILHSVTRGAMFSLGLLGIYTAIWNINQAKEMAMLAGSIGVFLILAAIMYSTRKFDWYAFDQHKKILNHVDQSPDQGL